MKIILISPAYQFQWIPPVRIKHIKSDGIGRVNLKTDKNIML